MSKSIDNILSDVLDSSYRYNMTRSVQIQKYEIRRDNDNILIIEIITEDCGSTPTVIFHRGFSTADVERIMNHITSAL